MILSNMPMPINSIEWNRSIIDDEHFSVIHDGVIKKYNSLYVALMDMDYISNLS